MPSDLHFFVRFEQPAVFAGEEVRCIITFRNIDSLPPPKPGGGLRSGRHSRRTSFVEQIATTPRLTNGGSNLENLRLGALNVHTARKGSGPEGKDAVLRPKSAIGEGRTESQSLATEMSKPIRPGSKHQRSVSIISMGSPDNDVGLDHFRGGPVIQPQRPPVGHKRASTVQISSDRQDRSGQLVLLAADQHSSRYPRTGPHRNPSSASNEGRRSTPNLSFPSASNAIGSGRSSGELDSLSNHSQETLASEQASVMSERPQFPASRIRQHYNMDPAPLRKPQTVNLLMGYAQVIANFVLDGSLIDQSPFEEVKRKGFLGGQAGGGVVGVNSVPRKNGFLGSLNLDAIGESISGLLGTNDLSSLKEMKNVTSSKAVPLISTPQSLLFVDLRLAPGDEKSFSFSYRLPQGLPSSHRGKVLKVTYNLVVGVQGSPSGKDLQAIRKVNVPFRVFSGVHDDGEILGHDLMQPYVILQDSAKTEVVENSAAGPKPRQVVATVGNQSDEKKFLDYVDILLDTNRRRQSSSGTLTQMLNLAPQDGSSHSKDAIDRAILFGNHVSSSDNRAPNRFEIATDGQHVAVIVLDRALHRLGETITATIDFEGGRLKCYSLRASLETSETVNPALALRSAASIARVTRRSYVSCLENTLFTRRTVFSPSIPMSATPTLMTSGVNLNWALRFEFVVLKRPDASQNEELQTTDILEQIVQDERGTISVAVELMDCESFEVEIPLTVYGEIVANVLDNEETLVFPI